MRIVVAAFAAALSLVFVPGFAAFAADGATATASEATGREAPQDAPALSRTEQLDKLFDQLKAADSDDAAEQAENGIAAIWLKSGSDTVDLLMQWAEDAVKDKNYPLALDYLDRILTLKPDYVEGWNTRSTVYFLRDDYGHALADIERTLALEPRHFGALAGLGTILREIGDDRRALEVYRKVYALNPHMPHVKEAIDDLSAQGVDGRAL